MSEFEVSVDLGVVDSPTYKRIADLLVEQSGTVSLLPRQSHEGRGLVPEDLIEAAFVVYVGRQLLGWMLDTVRAIMHHFGKLAIVDFRGGKIAISKDDSVSANDRVLAITDKDTSVISIKPDDLGSAQSQLNQVLESLSKLKKPPTSS